MFKGINKMVIIEGLDGTGKSTVSNKLIELGYIVHHLTYEEKSEEGYLSVLKRDTDKLALDRSFISELVYGPILRNYSRINEVQTKNIIDHYCQVGVKIIYLKSSKVTLLDRRKNDKEDVDMLNRYFEQINDGYDKVIKWLSPIIPVVEIDTSVLNEEETIQIIMDFLGSEEKTLKSKGDSIYEK